ncbi:MAG: HPr family phosphocarrier protein [Lachnospiraceae bacterium]|nr:HPr family phosphocarrier protein [Lachnospiraceae bacterium]
MVKEKIIIQNPAGLHLRPAGKISTAASAYQSSIHLYKGNRSADAKSLLALLGACIKFGDEVECICEGEDEEAALAEVVGLLGTGFLNE